MTSFPMVNLIWFSQKRTRILMSLLEGPKTSEELTIDLEIDLRALHLPIKELKEGGMINYEDGIASLSNLGRIISRNAKPAYEMTNMFELNMNYWTSRNLTDIPRSFARRLGELGDCELFKQDMNHMFQLPQKFVMSTSNTKSIISVLSFFYPEQLNLYNEAAKKGSKLSIIVTEGVYQTLQDNFQEMLNYLEESQGTEIYCLPDITSPPSFTITDTTLLISFYNKNKRYDHQDMFSNSESALKWSTDLFNYYREQSYEKHKKLNV